MFLFSAPLFQLAELETPLGKAKARFWVQGLGFMYAFPVNLGPQGRRVSIFGFKNVGCMVEA